MLRLGMTSTLIKSMRTASHFFHPKFLIVSYLSKAGEKSLKLQTPDKTLNNYAE